MVVEQIRYLKAVKRTVLNYRKNIKNRGIGM